MLTATSSNFDVFDVDSNIKNWVYTVYNDVNTSPFLTIPGTWHWYTSWTVNVYSHATTLNSWETYMTYLDTAPWGNQSLIRTGISSAIMSSNLSAVWLFTVEASHGSWRVFLGADGVVVWEETEVILTPTAVNIDAKWNDLFVNEGTTATGTNTASTGDVLENKTGWTWETKRTTIRYDETLTAEWNGYTITHNLGVQYPTSITFYNTVSGKIAVIPTENHVLNAFDLDLPWALTFTGVVTVSK
jgi:hypothetical protein